MVINQKGYGISKINFIHRIHQVFQSKLWRCIMVKMVMNISRGEA